MNLSLTQARLTGAWPVHDDYRVDSGYLAPVGSVHFYYQPEDDDDLPFAISKLAEAGAEDIRRFAQTRGLLGISAMSDRQEYERLIESAQPLGKELSPPITFASAPGDLLDDVRKHARVLSLCVKLYEGLSVRRGRRSLAATLKSPVALQFLAGQPAIERPTVPATGEAMLAFIVSKHIEGVRPYSSEEDGAVRHKFTGLIEVAHLHLAWLREKKGRIARCLECGAIFRKRDERQRFCPGEQWLNARDKWQRTESFCGQKYRYKQRRLKKEAKS